MFLHLAAVNNECECEQPYTYPADVDLNPCTNTRLVRHHFSTNSRNDPTLFLQQEVSIDIHAQINLMW